MANVNQVEVPGVGTGILMPAMQYQWMVRVEGTPDLIAMQAVACFVRYLPQEVILDIEQDRYSAEIHNIIQELINGSKRKIIVSMLDGNCNALVELIFNGCRVDNHYMELDYAVSGPVKHCVAFGYDSLDIVDNNVKTEVKTEDDYERAMAIVNPRAQLSMTVTE